MHTDSGGHLVNNATATSPTRLADLAVGQSARVVRIETNGAIRQRLLDMGVTRGAEVLVKRVAPLGDPIEVSIKGYNLAIRRYEAQTIRVRPQES